DEELSEEIVKMAAFQSNGQFSREVYQRALARAGLTPTAFEQDVRAQLLQRRLQGLVAARVKVSAAEVRQHWENRQARVRAGYLAVSPEAFLGGVQVTDADREAYYKDHPGEYTRPERRRVLAALLPSASVPFPTVSDAEVETAYQERLREFHQPEKRRGAPPPGPGARDAGGAARRGPRPGPRRRSSASRAARTSPRSRARRPRTRRRLRGAASWGSCPAAR